MFTSKIDKQIKQNQKKIDSENFKRIFNAISQLPVCVLVSENTILNTVNGISIDHDQNFSGSGLSTKVNGIWRYLDLKTAERILENWTVMSKKYMFLNWDSDMTSAAAQDNSRIDINSGQSEHVQE